MSNIVENSNLAPVEYDDEICKNFKAIYYLLNAKPDTETRLFNKKKKFNLININDLNTNLEEKLRLHNVETTNSSLIVELEESEIIEFSNFIEFLNYNWKLKNKRTIKITYLKEFYIKFHNYKLPQRHNIKIRIGGGVTAKEAINLFLTRDSESHEAKLYNSDMTCRIDYINNVLASEIFDLVEKWYDSLEGKEINFLVKFFEKNETLCRKISEIIINSFAILFYINLLKQYLIYINFIPNFKNFLAILHLIAIFSIIYYQIYDWVINEYRDHFFFSFFGNKDKNINLTSKDEKEINKRFQKQIKKIVSFFIINFFIFILNTVFSKCIEILKNF